MTYFLRFPALDSLRTFPMAENSLNMLVSARGKNPDGHTHTDGKLFSNILMWSTNINMWLLLSIMEEKLLLHEHTDGRTDTRTESGFIM